MKFLLVSILLVATSQAILFGDDYDFMDEPYTDVDPACLQKADAGDCDFYKCFSERFPCARGVLQLGMYQTCSSMTARKSEMTAEGRNWLTKSRTCFHNQLKLHYQANSLACEGFKSAAIRAYMTCANTVRPNMCEIFWENRAVITEVLNISVDRIMENPRRGLKNIYGLARMLSRCGGDEIKTFLNELKASFTESIRRNLKFPWEDK